MPHNFFDILVHHDLPCIDLHEYEDVSDAIFFLERELYRLYKKDEQYVRVIHGIGTGFLKKTVEDILRQHVLVKDFKPSSDDGSTIVLLT